MMPSPTDKVVRIRGSRKRGQLGDVDMQPFGLDYHGHMDAPVCRSL